MSFHLGIWHTLTAISDDEAARLYGALSGGTKQPLGFDPQVYAFYFQLTDLYPEIDMVPDNEINDACPWACNIDLADGFVILGIRSERSDQVVPEVVALAHRHDLVCFDPQSGKVHLPPSLAQQRSRTA